MAIKGKGSKKKIPEGLWSKCPKCDQIVHNKELAENGKICPKCAYCYPLSALERVALLLGGLFCPFETNLTWSFEHGYKK